MEKSKEVGIYLEKALTALLSLYESGPSDDFELKMAKDLDRWVRKGCQWVKENLGYRIEECIDSYAVLSKDGGLSYSGNYEGAVRHLIHICKTL